MAWHLEPMHFSKAQITYFTSLDVFFSYFAGWLHAVPEPDTV